MEALEIVKPVARVMEKKEDVLCSSRTEYLKRPDCIHCLCVEVAASFGSVNMFHLSACAEPVFGFLQPLRSCSGMNPFTIARSQRMLGSRFMEIPSAKL